MKLWGQGEPGCYQVAPVCAQGSTQTATWLDSTSRFVSLYERLLKLSVGHMQPVAVVGALLCNISGWMQVAG